MEHDPKACGCTYLGCDMWSCGHIDNEPDDKKTVTVDGVTVEDICEQCGLNVFDCKCPE